MVNLNWCWSMVEWKWWFNNKRWVDSSYWWSASVNLIWWKCNTFFISCTGLQNSMSSIKLNSHGLVSAHERLKLIREGHILCCDNTVVTLHGSNLRLQVWVLVEEASVRLFQTLNFIPHAGDSALDGGASDGKIVDVGRSFTILHAGFMNLSCESCVSFHLNFNHASDSCNLCLSCGNFNN